MFRSIPPVTVDRRARTVAFAHEEESAAAAAAVCLISVVKGDIAFKSRVVGLDEVDSLLIGTAAVAPLSVAFDPANRSSGVRVAPVPDTRCFVVPACEHP